MTTLPPELATFASLLDALLSRCGILSLPADGRGEGDTPG